MTSVRARRRGPMRGMLAAVMAGAALAGCVAAPTAPFAGPALGGSYTPAPPPADRAAWAARFDQLAATRGISPPELALLSAPPGADPAAGYEPVLRVTFPDHVFFDTASDAPRPDSEAILDQVAQAVRSSGPETQITVAGHTDAVGSDAYNMDLSRRRASAVVGALAVRGVNPAELSLVAAGKRQPVASDATAEGRAQNRRVVLFVSGSAAANLAALQQGTVNPAFLAPGEVPDAGSVEVYRPNPLAGGALAAMPPLRLTTEASAAAPALPRRAALAVPRARLSAAPAPRSLERVPLYRPNALQQYRQRELGPEQRF